VPSVMVAELVFQHRLIVVLGQWKVDSHRQQDAGSHSWIAVVDSGSVTHSQ
jgi:hypothetical protein